MNQNGFDRKCVSGNATDDEDNISLNLDANNIFSDINNNNNSYTFNQRSRNPKRERNERGNDEDDDEETDDHEESIPLRLNDENEETDSGLSYCRGLSQKPLAVPMVADTNQNSVTRNDAKAITHSRLCRLKELSQRPEDELSKDQKDEKKRIIRLEKNRRAAAMSRRKKKMYVKNLEERNQLMTKHLALLEMENAHLRAVINATHPHGPHPHIPHIPNMANLQNTFIPTYIPPSSSSSNTNNLPPSSTNSTTNTLSYTNTTHNSSSTSANDTSSNTPPNSTKIEVSIEPARKRRKLNDGTSTSTRSPSCSSELSALEPLPLGPNNLNFNNIQLPPNIPLPRFMQIPSNLPSHIIPPNIPQLIPPNIAYRNKNNNNNNNHILPKIGKVDLTGCSETNSNKDQNEKYENENETKEECKSLEEIEQQQRNGKNADDNHNNDLPPEVYVPMTGINGEHLSLWDDDLVLESVQESGSVIECDEYDKSRNLFV